MLQAGLAAMQRYGKPLTRVRTKGRSMVYSMQNGETVRVRTCNDHLLIIGANAPTPNAQLNIEGTDWLLIIMPQVERTVGSVLVYLVPTVEAVSEARKAHSAWLATQPNTAGQNRTWALWFSQEGPEVSNDYANKWSRYLLVNDLEIKPPHENGTGIKYEVELARKRIAIAAGVPVEAVKITINFEG